MREKGRCDGRTAERLVWIPMGGVARAADENGGPVPVQQSPLARSSLMVEESSRRLLEQPGPANLLAQRG
jgi:hypothetical protein